MRALAVDNDVIVFISRVWQTTSTAVRSGDEGFLIDSPVYPDELEAVPDVLSQAEFPVSGLLATAVARLMQTLLFRTTAYDPMVFGGVIFVLALIALLAALTPALRATKADPVAALRAE